LPIPSRDEILGSPQSSDNGELSGAAAAAAGGEGQQGGTTTLGRGEVIHGSPVEEDPSDSLEKELAQHPQSGGH
jgi:hypothetical protein